MVRSTPRPISISSADLGLDLVVVVAPMSTAPRVRRRSVDLPLRRLFRLRLAGEAARVRRSGTRVIAFQPNTLDQETMGLNAMDRSRAARVARQSLDTLLRLGRREAVHRLEPLAA